MLVETYLGEIGFSPPAAEFGERIERFAATLALWGSRTNLTAHPGDPAEIAFHVIDSLAPLVLAARRDAAILKQSFATASRVLDLGSGAGFPGLILAAACDARFTLLEGRRKRISFLRVAAAEMRLENVAVAESAGVPLAFDVAVGRAFAKPAVFYRAAGERLRAGGRAILFANADQSVDEPAALAVKLTDGLMIPYEILRGEVSASRILAIWQKSR
jgi:16S rRNA (guanine527-N7)-methyltransferase